MGYLKSMSSAMRTSASNSVARHSYVSSSRASCRHLITRALPCIHGMCSHLFAIEPKFCCPSQSASRLRPLQASRKFPQQGETQSSSTTCTPLQSVGVTSRVIRRNNAGSCMVKFQDRAGACRLYTIAELVAVLIAGVSQGLVKADVLACALAQLVHLAFALRGCKLIPVVLLTAQEDFQDCFCLYMQPAPLVCSRCMPLKQCEAMWL